MISFLPIHVATLYSVESKIRVPENALIEQFMPGIVVVLKQGEDWSASCGQSLFLGGSHV